MFEKGQRKDDVAAAYRKKFSAAEGVLFPITATPTADELSTLISPAIATQKDNCSDV